MLRCECGGELDLIKMFENKDDPEVTEFYKCLSCNEKGKMTLCFGKLYLSGCVTNIEEGFVC